MIPIVLFLFDIAVLVLGNTANDNLAKQAARAAASAVNSSGQGDPTSAQNAAGTIVGQFQTSGFINAVSFPYIYFDGVSPSNPATSTNVFNGKPTFTISLSVSTAALDPNGVPAVAQNDPGPGNVAVVTAMQVQPPVPFPYIGTTRVFFARAVEPIVSVSP